MQIYSLVFGTSKVSIDISTSLELSRPRWFKDIFVRSGVLLSAAFSCCCENVYIVFSRTWIAHRDTYACLKSSSQVRCHSHFHSGNSCVQCWPCLNLSSKLKLMKKSPTMRCASFTWTTRQFWDLQKAHYIRSQFFSMLNRPQHVFSLVFVFGVVRGNIQIPSKYKFVCITLGYLLYTKRQDYCSKYRSLLRLASIRWSCSDISWRLL